MPYNTRRKSLSLPSLGIQLPNASRAHRPSISKASLATETPQQPPTKKIKRSHTSNSPSPTSPPRPKSSATSNSTKVVSFADRPKSSGRVAYEHTPPPSPRASTDNKVDTEGISDDIVVGVIEQLEKTGNRPHLIKELATVLSSISDAVSSSANPAALLSSRLSAYLKRPWSALSPCPLDKELTTVHPRKVYYFLTTLPRQDFPTALSDVIISAHSGGKGGRRIISPSISSASIDGDTEAAEERNRDAMSPSPEIDLSEDLDVAVPGVDDFATPPTPAGSSFSGRSSLARDGSNGSSSDIALSHNHKAASPPLEGDEKEFTQTASSMRMRGMSLDDPTIRPSTEDPSEGVVEETEEEKAKRNREAAEALFGGHHSQDSSLMITSSPLMKAIQPIMVGKETKQGEDVEMKESTSILGDSGVGLTWDTREAEDIQIEDLDDLFGAF